MATEGLRKLSCGYLTPSHCVDSPYQCYAPQARIFAPTGEGYLIRQKYRRTYFSITKSFVSFVLLSLKLQESKTALAGECRDVPTVRPRQRMRGKRAQRCLKDMLSGIYATNMDNPVRVPIGTKCGEACLHTILLPCVFA